jgi:hypothetical protein
MNEPALNEASFRQGFCDAFALALHRRTGWPLALLVGLYPDTDGFLDDDGNPEDVIEVPAHAVCLAPGEGLLADVTGIRPLAEVRGHLLFDEEPEGVGLVRVEAEAMGEAFTTEGVAEWQVAAAAAFIDAHAERWGLAEA